MKVRVSNSFLYINYIIKLYYAKQNVSNMPKRKKVQNCQIVSYCGEDLLQTIAKTCLHYKRKEVDYRNAGELDSVVVSSRLLEGHTQISPGRTLDH